VPDKSSDEEVSVGEEEEVEDLTETADKVVLQESIPAQIRQLVLHIRNCKGQVDEFVWELTLAERLQKHFVCEKTSDEEVGVGEEVEDGRV
jgi:hypothetical protein